MPSSAAFFSILDPDPFFNRTIPAIFCQGKIYRLTGKMLRYLHRILPKRKKAQMTFRRPSELHTADFYNATAPVTSPLIT